MKWGWTKFLVTCLIFFTLGFNLVLPFFTKQEPVSAATATFGSTGNGNGDGGWVAGRARAVRVTPASDGVLTSISAYCRETGGVPHVTMFVQNASGYTLSLTEEKAITTGGLTWYTFNLTTPQTIVAGTYYYLGGMCSGSGNLGYDDSTGTLYYQGSLTYPNPGSPASYTTYSPQTPCIYGTYTVSDAWKNVTQGYFSFSNSSSFKTPTSGYFSLLNSASFKNVNVSFFSFSNSSLFTSVTDGWFNLSNTSSMKDITSGWFSFASTREWWTPSSGYFSFRNTSSLTNLVTGWFTFQNTPNWQNLSSGYFNFSNSVSWQSILQQFITLYENQESSTNTYNVYGVSWRGQTFTPTTTHTLTMIGIKVGRIGNPGTFTVSIRATSAGKPTGGDLCSGTLNGNGLPLIAAWQNITMTPPITLTSGTMYAIVTRATTGDVSNVVFIRGNSPNIYSSGTNVNSANSGSSWSIVTTIDLTFRDYGIMSLGYEGYFVFSNTGTVQTVTQGYCRFSNLSVFQSAEEGYFLFRNGTISEGYFTFANVSTFGNVVEGYFLFSSGVTWFSLEQGYFSFSNVSTNKEIASGWFNFTNTSSLKTFSDGWFRLSNIPAWNNVRAGYFSFRNVSNWNLLASGWFSFQNMSNATPIVRILLPHPGETVRYNTPFLVTYSVYSSKKEPVNVSLQLIYLGDSQWINLTNQALNSDDYYLNSTIDISLIMAALGITADYNSPYVINLSATNYVTHLYGDDQSNFKLRDATYDMIILFFPLIILILFSLLAFWKQSKIILTATITTAILYAVMLATSFAGVIDSWYVVLLIVYALALSTMFFFWKKKGVKV